MKPEAAVCTTQAILRSLLRQLTFSRDQQRTVHEAIIAKYERRKVEAIERGSK